jgi:hypothetical protein
MPIDFGAYLTNGLRPSDQYQIRAQIQQSRIEDKAILVSFLRDGIYLPEQQVRIEYDNSVTKADSELGSVGMRKVILFGVKGHPTVDDLDVRVWDTFRMDEVEYTVVQVNRTLIGQIQVHCEGVG